MLNSIFERAKAEGRGVLIAYLTVGDPSVEATPELVDALVEAGADVVELGVPFSDPVADGPTIQAASQRALERGATLADVFAVGKEVHARHPGLGLVLMGYANPLYRFGLRAAAAASKEAGITGWIVPDVPHEEAWRFQEFLNPEGVSFIPLLAPTTSPERAKGIVEDLKPPFVYYVSVTGVTGARKGFPEGWYEPLEAHRAVSPAPYVVGFGISSPELAAEARAHADGVVVGSALIDRIAAGDPAGSADRIREFIGGLKAAL